MSLETTMAKDLGCELEKEYWEKPPSTSIHHIVIMFNKDISKKIEQIKEGVEKHTIWKPLENKWEANKLLILEFIDRKERNQEEEEINSSIRETLKSILPGVGIIFTRACLYTKKPKELPRTNYIGEILRSKYQQTKLPIDYFYLIIQAVRDCQHLHEMAFEGVQKLQQESEQKQLQAHTGEWRERHRPYVGEWDELDKNDWPGVFFGYYPKTAFMTEREREWILNKDVREPLIAKLQEQIKPPPQTTVHIIITRACLYTAHEQPSYQTQESETQESETETD